MLYVGLSLSIPAISFTYATFAVRLSQRRTNSRGTGDRTPERSLSNVTCVADVFQTVVISRNIDGYITVRSDFYVNFAARDFIGVEILLSIAELIRARSLTHAMSVIKIFVEEEIFQVIVALILERNHLNASIVGNTFLVVDILYCTIGHTLDINLTFVKDVTKIFVLRVN
jgi:hypothetical protein